MSRSVRFLDDAIVEARAAFLWYRKRSEIAAGRFREEFNLAITAVCSSPEAWPRYVQETRRYLFRRFLDRRGAEEGVLFRIGDDGVRLVALDRQPAPAA